jgi:4-amino-4-deoxy-L-arabinose transferase-like glycosyltransferase
MEKEITIEIKHLEIIALLAFLCLALFLELQVTLNSHITFGDEGFHAKISWVIAQKVEFPKWIPVGETEITKQGFARPQLLNLLGASLFYIFGFNEWLLKALIPFIGSMLTGIALFVLTKRIYDSKVAFVASVIGVSLPSLVTYSVLYYTEILFTFYFFTSILTLVLAIKTDENKYWILSGLFCGLSFLTKTPAFALFPLVAVVFLYQLYKRSGFLKTMKKYILWGVFAGLLIIPFFVRGYVLYKNPSCNLLIFPFFSTEGCTYSQEVEQQYKFEGTAEQVGTEQDIFKMGIMNYFNFAYGNVWFTLLGFLCGLSILAWRKKTDDIIILLAFFSIFFIIIRNYDTRAENMNRWLLGWTPIFAVIAGNYFVDAYEFIKKYIKIIAIIIFIVVMYFSFTSLQEKTNTMMQVKKFSPLFFEACDWIKQNTPKDIRIAGVIWGSSTTFNCQRDIGGGGPDIALSQNTTLMLSELKASGATHLFIQKFSISWTDQKLSEKYPISYVRFLESHPEHFKKIYENGPLLDECQSAGGCDGTIVYEIIY